MAAPGNGCEIKFADIFNMESQSKTLATNTKKLIAEFATPRDENVFKLKLDDEIPNFSLLVEDALV